ncbi:MAG: T9SS type A sorting domain-containing protein, partial [Flavobacteriales bacterium]|nr:T9SS type A sorting domain-containing protein [Flavobacteriales bacterium]
DILFWIYKKWDGFPIGIDDIENDKLIIDNAITIYPNPTQDQFTVSGITENSSITVLDVMGKVVHYTPKTINQTQITTENWAKGLYVVQIKGNKSSTTLKVIKQ